MAQVECSANEGDRRSERRSLRRCAGEQSIERPVDIVFPVDSKLAAQAAKLGKPMAEVAGGKMSAPFSALSNMVLSHASDEGASDKAPVAAAKSLVDSLRSMLAKPKDKAA